MSRLTFKTNDIEELAKEESREIKQILDRRQRAQFNIIKHLERQDIKRSLKEIFL